MIQYRTTPNKIRITGRNKMDAFLLVWGIFILGMGLFFNIMLMGNWKAGIAIAIFLLVYLFCYSEVYFSEPKAQYQQAGGLVARATKAKFKPTNTSGFEVDCFLVVKDEKHYEIGNKKEDAAQISDYIVLHIDELILK